MARGSDQARGAATAAQNLSNQYAGNAQSGFNTLMPELQTEAAHPAGFNPVDLARMNTGAQQTAGGSNAGAVGQGALLGARTKNPGAAPAAIAESTRESGQQLSKNALGIQTANARLREEQRQEGMKGLQGLTGLETGAGINALGEVAPNVNADVNAKNASWDWAKYILDPTLQAAGGAASGYLAGQGGGGGGR
jgi:hypothetical protein